MKYLYLLFAAILLVCLFHLPYGAYNLIRFVAMVGFGLIAFKYFSKEKPAVGVPAAALALLFQPFLKIHLGRGVWNVVDVIAAIALVALFFYEMKKESNHEIK